MEKGYSGPFCRRMNPEADAKMSAFGEGPRTLQMEVVP